jgi:hypothetical protein
MPELGRVAEGPDGLVGVVAGALVEEEELGDGVGAAVEAPGLAEGVG